MVGEMRDPETMRLTLNASETGHLVLATVHSATCAEALQRVVSAFPAEIQAGVCAQLADCLVAVISQRLHYRPEQGIRVPECEILVASHAVKSLIRQRDFSKIISAIETGADHDMWSFARYARWLDSRTNWSLPDRKSELTDNEADEPVRVAPMRTKREERQPVKSSAGHVAGQVQQEQDRIEIEPDEGGLGKILKHLE
jgi:twitching motility protein PilT